jgi:hypothetical protein
MHRIAIALALVGCATDERTTETTQTVRYRDHIQPIWDTWCVQCHNFHTPHLTARDSATELQGLSWRKCDGGVEKARFVVPSDPSKSYLLYRLTMQNTNNYDPTACGRAMPADFNGQGDTPLIELDPAAVATIRTWIEEGAVFD